MREPEHVISGAMDGAIDSANDSVSELTVTVGRPTRWWRSFFQAWPYLLILAYLLIALMVLLGWVGQNWAGEVGPAFAASSAQFWLGTNALGQDHAARLAQAIAQLWQTVLPQALLALLVGVAAGVIMAASAPRWPQAVLRYLADLCDSLPSYLLLISISVALKSAVSGAFMMVLLFWPSIARAVDLQMRALWQQPYMDAARVTGASDWRLWWVHALPLLRPLIFGLALNALSNCMKAQLVLGFIGLDGNAAPSLGALLSAGVQDALAYHYQTLVTPFAVSFLFLLACDSLANRQPLKN